MLNLIKTIAAAFVTVTSAAPREYVEEDIILNRADKAAEPIEQLVEISHY